MKKCPYCAEEIQEEAAICRYCHRRIKKSWLRPLIVAFVIITLIVFAIVFERQVQRFIFEIKYFLKDMYNLLTTLRNIIKDITNGLAKIKDYHSTIESVKEIQIQ